MQFGTPVLADPNNTIEQAAQTAVEVAEAEVTATGDAQILLNGGYQTVEIYSTIPGAKTTTNGQTDPCAPKTGRPDFAIATVNNRTQSEIADTTLHEFGHGMDDLLSNYVPGNTSDNLSDSAAAAAAIAADIKAMGPEEAQAYAGLDPANIIADLYESSMANSYSRGYDQLGNLMQLITDLLFVSIRPTHAL